MTCMSTVNNFQSICWPHSETIFVQESSEADVLQNQWICGVLMLHVYILIEWNKNRFLVCAQIKLILIEHIEAKHFFLNVDASHTFSVRQQGGSIQSPWFYLNPMCTPTSSPLVRSAWGTAKWSGTYRGSSCHLAPVRSCRQHHRDSIITFTRHPAKNQIMCGCWLFSVCFQLNVHHGWGIIFID